METKETLTASLKELKDTVALHMEYLHDMHPAMQAALYDADMEGVSEFIQRLDEFAKLKFIK